MAEVSWRLKTFLLHLFVFFCFVIVINGHGNGETLLESYSRFEDGHSEIPKNQLTSNVTQRHLLWHSYSQNNLPEERWMISGQRRRTRCQRNVQMTCDQRLTPINDPANLEDTTVSKAKGMEDKEDVEQSLDALIAVENQLHTQATSSQRIEIRMGTEKLLSREIPPSSQ